MIDFVITWVDGEDPDWIREKSRYCEDRYVRQQGEDTDEVRYRDWGLLKYLLRGIDRYAPWVHRIYLVTAGQKPEWLNLRQEKLRLITHEDFLLPENLPTFNSNAIEVNLHRIPGLSEQFVYFNDDFLLLRPVRPEHFFRKGMPVDMLALQPVIANPENPVMSSILLNDSLVISRHFRKWENMKRHPGAYFHPGYPPMYFIYNALERAFPQYTGFYTVHGPSPLLKKTFRTLWKSEPEVLRETSAHRFRSREDVTQYLFREWQKQTGRFYPCNLHADFAYFDLGNDNRGLYQTLLGHKKRILCVNDANKGYDIHDPDAVKRKLTAVLEKTFPGKSRFER